MESRAFGVGKVRVSTFLPSTPAPASTALAKVICSCSGESTS